ncbi:MazG-like family protein [Phycicoccus sp.]|uniref:MazG-like family protein n=1 Tax=Phycicoccus sp. TaxID=1902410 RepID=UPI002C394356|nr:MazG-like family protein [Phycicoccus sp.]HMM95317.1 MazG-like family protein [Phycicoccus sp.]
MSSDFVADLPCPECRAGKHGNCDGTSMDSGEDAIGACPCATSGHATRTDDPRDLVGALGRAIDAARAAAGRVELPHTSPAEPVPSPIGEDAGSEGTVEPGVGAVTSTPGSGRPTPGELIARLSQYIDDSYPIDLSPEAADWRRIAKVGEEFGEVIGAFGGSIGENPRKGVTHQPGDVDYELLDVALCALGAWEHRHGNAGMALPALHDHIAHVARRAGITP